MAHTYQWLPDFWRDSCLSYAEYAFWKNEFNAIDNVQFISEQEIIYIKSSRYLYQEIEFCLVVDLDYDDTYFYIINMDDLDKIRNLVEKN